MDEMSVALVSKALDGLAMRATATAQNVANANSETYSPVRVSFEDSLRQAALEGAEAVRNVNPQMVRGTPGTSDGELRLDLEIATASQTSMRYAALIDILGRQIQIERTMVRGGQ